MSKIISIIMVSMLVVACQKTISKEEQLRNVQLKKELNARVIPLNADLLFRVLDGRGADDRPFHLVVLIRQGHQYWQDAPLAKSADLLVPTVRALAEQYLCETGILSADGVVVSRLPVESEYMPLPANAVQVKCIPA
ncbi:hypothetical protein [Curvivirga aplysinae]|uniref:hypothetical protein n=1 Tax=Curvivirga aplysinae TaxID=2529852 RepID=UPI0012BC2330|nr:hypothetical protein [Curvivirga aplysinae]MTI09955.1 hypothetical protein [Curvivirga aplysinae]